MDSRYALITGTSAGIGAAFARAYAKRGVNLILTARRLDRLQALATECKSLGVDALCLAADLADPAAPAQLCGQIKEAGKSVDILVNNAGYGVPGSFLAVDWKTHQDFLQVMQSAPLELCHRLLPGMRERRYGRVLNIASLAGLVPAAAGHTLYGAVKSFLIKYSQALALENQSAGIHVTAVCPGFTYSEFHDVSGARNLVNKMPKWIWQQANDVVNEAIAANERGDIVRVTGAVNRMLYRASSLLPDRLALALVKRQGKQFRVVE
jgi:uncharacterized protein